MADMFVERGYDFSPDGDLQKENRWLAGAGPALRAFRAFRSQTRVRQAVIAALLLSFSSFVTTFIGIANFHFHWTVAFVTALGIQLLMYLTAWIYAEARANRTYLKRLRQRELDDDSETVRQAKAKAEGAGRIVGPSMLFLAMACSIFFSFDALFDAVYKPEQQILTNLKVARSDIGGIFGRLSDTITDQRQAIIEELEADEGWIAWKSNVDKILKVAEGARELLTAATNRERARATTALDEARRNAKEKADEVARLQAALQAQSGQSETQTASDVEAVERRIAELTKRRAETQAAIDVLQGQADELQVKMDVEEKAGGVGPDGTRRPAKRGPFWRGFKRDQDDVIAQIEARKQELAGIEEEIARTKARQEELVSGRNSAEAALQTAMSQLSDLRLLEKEAEESFNGLMATAGPGGAPADSGDLVQRVREGIDRFVGDGSRQAFQVFTEGCGSILAELTAHETTKAMVDGASCETSAFAPYVDRLQRYDDAQTALAEKCKVDESFNNLDTVKAMVDKGRSCIGLSTLPYDVVTGERDLVDSVEQENSPATSHFERAWATLERGDKLAWLAAGIAFSIDFFILGSALIGASSLVTPLYASGHIGSQGDLDEIQAAQSATSDIHRGDPPAICNQKTLLRFLQMEDVGDGNGTEFVIDLRSEQVRRAGSASRSTLAIQLTAYVAKGLARTIQGRPGAYVVHKSLVQHIAAVIGHHEREWQRNNPEEAATMIADAPDPFEPDPWRSGKSMWGWSAANDSSNADDPGDKPEAVQSANAAGGAGSSGRRRSNTSPYFGA